MDEETSTWSQKFTLPLDLIASRSPYFKSLFESGFAESEQGFVKLRDVPPWVFRVFVGWLYYQHIFYDPEQKKARQFAGKATSHAQKNKAAQTKTKVNADTTEADNEATQKSSIDHTSESHEEGTTSQEIAEATTTSEQSTSKGAKAAGKHPDRATKTTYKNPPGGNQNKYYQELDITYGEEQNDADECNYHEPTTWPSKWLFELYVLADKYDAPDFGTSIFEIIQMKHLQVHPRRYLLPRDSDVTYATDNLPPTSPLYRFLVDAYAVWLGFSTLPTYEGQVQAYDDLPAPFLSRCMVAMKRFHYASQCEACKPGGTGAECSKTDHAKEDALMLPAKDYCTYHVHKTDEERARCTLRWESRRHRL